MATVEPPEVDPFEIDLQEAEPEKETILQFSDLLDMNEDGTDCITDENLDFIWPRDPDQEPAIVVGKSFVMPPACTGPFIPCEEKYGRETCLKFVFDGPPLPPSHTVVPLGSSGLMLASALAIAFTVKKFST